MGRRRKTRLDLPQRVYFNHGAYFYAPLVGGRIHLGRDFGLAMAKWAEIVARPAKLATMGEVMDRYMLEVAPKKSPRTYQDNIKEMARLRAVFGHMQPNEITAPDIYAYMDARGAPIRAISGCSRQPRATSGFWRNADWLPCIDGKARPVEPGTFPLAHGAPARVGRLRAYGNAICAETAAEFIRAFRPSV